MLPRLIDQHCRINGRWLSKPKRVLNDLEVWDARAARLARQACNDQAQVRDRGAAARALADHDPCADWRSHADGLRNRKTRPPRT
jgi:hypothetical protein